MNIGDRVRHKLTGEMMEIRTIRNGMTTCWRIDQPKEWCWWQGEKVFQHPRCICEEKNLEEIEVGQLRLL